MQRPVSAKQRGAAVAPASGTAYHNGARGVSDARR